MHQWQKFGENLSIDTGDIVEAWKSGMHSIIPWPWTLTFWPQNLISSSLSWDAPVTKVWRKSFNRYWRYRGNIKLPRESRTDGGTDGRPENIASAGAYRWRRLKNMPHNICLNDSKQIHIRSKQQMPRITHSKWNGFFVQCLNIKLDNDEYV